MNRPAESQPQKSGVLFNLFRWFLTFDIIRSLGRGNDSSSKFRLQFCSSHFRNISTTFGNIDMLSESFRILLFGYFRRRSLRKSVEGELDVCHIISQRFLFQTFVVFIFSCLHTAPLPGNEISKQSIFAVIETSAFPFVGKHFPDFDTAKTLVNPFFGITKTTIISHSLFYREFRVLHLVKTCGGDLCHPLLEWFGFRRWDGLNNTEQTLGICRHCLASFTIGSYHWNKGTNCTPVAVKLRVSRPHFLYILLWINAIRKHSHYIDDRKIPFLLVAVPYSSDLMVIKNLYLVLL